jgi:hypothetical protein
VTHDPLPDPFQQNPEYEQRQAQDYRNERTEGSAQSLTERGERELRLSLQAQVADISALALRAHEIMLPRTHKQAIRSPRAEDWRKAMQLQIDKLINKDTRTLVPYLKDPNACWESGFTTSNLTLAPISQISGHVG